VIVDEQDASRGGVLHESILTAEPHWPGEVHARSADRLDVACEPDGRGAAGAVTERPIGID
jgi:hypothetical protein